MLLSVGARLVVLADGAGSSPSPTAPTTLGTATLPGWAAALIAVAIAGAILMLLARWRRGSRLRE